MLSSSDSGKGDSLSTPKRLQKKLFNTQSVSSTKRNLFQTEVRGKNTANGSEDESDLGPMSPLAVTDSSCESSPGRQYDSPFTTPEKSPRLMSLTWDRLRPASCTRDNHGLSPFSSLKRLTRNARSTPRRRFSSNSPAKSSSSSSTPKRRPLFDNIIPETPRDANTTVIDGYLDDEIVPETPQKDGCDETPHKENYHERKLITPLGSVFKEASVPRLHRRKSICTQESADGSSPEPLKAAKIAATKRHLNESSSSFMHSGVKLLKTDENYSIPKARASLFPEEKSPPPQFAPLSTKSFYNSCVSDDKKRHSFGFGWRPVEKETKKRHSLPSQRKSGSRRSRFGQINAGVRHGIKRPKVKRRVDANDSLNKKSPGASKSAGADERQHQQQEIVPAAVEGDVNENIYSAAGEVEKENEPMETSGLIIPVKEKKVPMSPVREDPNKRFFKTNRTIKPRHVATVTVNDNIKLKVSDGKFALQQKKGKHVSKKPRLETTVTMDASDLTVDEPAIDENIIEKDVADLLKVLEDDWADDDYDNMESLAKANVNNRSPLKLQRSVRGDGLLMSPASVLSSMTSEMNIEDQAAKKDQDPGSSKEANQKLFPLFTKGFSSNIELFEETKKTGRGIKRPHGWQLSTKLNGGSDQYQLDAGQKRFGTTQCNECGVVYQIGEPEDENAHLIFHNSIRKLRFNGWKNEHVVYQDPFSDSRIITLEPNDPKHCWKKVEEIIELINQDLGLHDIDISSCQNRKIYFYVRNKCIVGVLVAESIKEAYRMIPELIDLDCCEETPSPAKCGVNVIWTALSHRRQGIARKLLNILRSHYYYGYIMSVDDLAFSTPSQGGKLFAEKYTGARNFKVYH
ncbi:N-acetyltransferase eco [Microplitis mediator]|uniref:N-acetyltransferase eco n=1 Tax=Microplitis mediator TaxID=375433 RepID=UPI00255338F7|nr:N-acetyltransferase eco [Microplitis mediator]